MTNVLGYQTLKICDPHGLMDVLVVKIEGENLVCHIPGQPPAFNWVKLKGGGDFGYTFSNLNKADYNINWNVGEIQYLDKSSLGKLSLCFYPDYDTSPIIVELLEIEERGAMKKLKVKILEQQIHDYGAKEDIIFEPSISRVTMEKKGDAYINIDFEDAE
ncbi:MAG: hypothetical protein FWG66_11260 [Spirochaetes bacterium]|nr:hypothetical protein [Spirochaetota bacterium]